MTTETVTTTFDPITTPTTGSEYYYLYSSPSDKSPFEIGNAEWSNEGNDMKRWNSGNFFNTYEEAEKCIGLVLSLLQGRQVLN